MDCRHLAIAFALGVGLAPVASATTVTITRDRWGVAHIFIPPKFGNRATQMRALAFAQGYATAQDRMVQLEFFRRAGKGRLSEIPFLASFLPMDIATRRDGLTDDERREEVRHLRGQVRRAFQGFADGVNQFLQEIAADPSRRPAEFALLGITPEPWDVTDTAAIAELEVRRFGQNGGNELGNASLLLDLLDDFPSAEAQGIFTDLFWLEDQTAPTTIDPAEQAFTPGPMTLFAPRQMALLSTYATEIRNAAMARAGEETMLASLGPQVGFPLAFPATASNAMVVSGALTASGNPIVLGGPQTGLNLPSFFYEIGLHGADYDAEGVTVPAGPGLVIGRTASAAWSLTSGITDNTDVYVEELNPSNAKQYRFGDGYRDMECRTETFDVSPPETHEFCRTVHGPVFASYPRVAFSKRLYFFGGEVKAAASLVSLGFAHDLKHFKRTIDKLEASLNCMYADNTGNIAYFHRGVRPLRPPDVDPRLPLPGDGSAEVRNLLKGRRMPTTINPALGFIGQWNNKPIKGWTADDQRELWGGADRVQILIDQLAAAKAVHHPITPADVTNYMKVAATVDQFAPRVFPYLRAAVDALPGSTPDKPRLDMAADLIGVWLSSGGGTLVADSSGNIPFPGLTIYREWRQQVQSDTFGDELGSHNQAMNYFQTSTGNNQDDAGSLFSPDALFLRVLAYPSAPVPASRDYFADVSTATNPGRDATLVDALRTALTTLENRYGTMDMTQWLTPKITVKFDDSASASPFAYGPTIIEREDRGTINEVVELGPTPVGQIIVPPGNSGHIPVNTNPEPPHLRDQTAAYEAFQFHSMPFTLADLEGPTTTQTLTVP